MVQSLLMRPLCSKKRSHSRDSSAIWVFEADGRTTAVACVHERLRGGEQCESSLPGDASGDALAEVTSAAPSCSRPGCRPDVSARMLDAADEEVKSPDLSQIGAPVPVTAEAQRSLRALSRSASFPPLCVRQTCTFHCRFQSLHVYVPLGIDGHQPLARFHSDARL
jgi:hypothetical protein